MESDQRPFEADASRERTSRAAIEALGAEGYRSGLLTETHLMPMLELDSRFAVHGWLRERRIPYRYTEADLATDLEHLTALGLR